jgi:L-cysteine S-thiosulfotransferase
MRLALILVAALSGAAAAEENTTPDAARLTAVIQAAFPTAPADWKPRLVPDETLRVCSAYRGNPPADVSKQIRNAEKAKIEYPSDGKLLGDWKAGEKIAQSGYGLRFTDYPPRQANGGNCYACHQLAAQELSYGTLGPGLLQYGKLSRFSEAATKAVYEKIYDPEATLPCSNMPRFGVNKVLTIEQIRDLVALVMSPDSPVNK